jgi:hypothetical protein
MSERRGNKISKSGSQQDLFYDNGNPLAGGDKKSVRKGKKKSAKKKWNKRGELTDKLISSQGTPIPFSKSKLNTESIKKKRTLQMMDEMLAGAELIDQEDEEEEGEIPIYSKIKTFQNVKQEIPSETIV